jgi:hypothetical protein
MTEQGNLALNDQATEEVTPSICHFDFFFASKSVP